MGKLETTKIFLKNVVPMETQPFISIRRSISLWNLAEEEGCHRKIIDEANKCEWILRSPTYSSIGNFETTGHDSEVVALRVLSKIEGEYGDSNNSQFMPIQVSLPNKQILVYKIKLTRHNFINSKSSSVRINLTQAKLIFGKKLHSKCALLV